MPRIALAVAAAMLLSAAMLAASTSSSLAVPQPTDVPAHRHWLQTGNGQWVEVGPRLCDDSRLQAAFNQFHGNVHVGSAATAFNHPHNPVSIRGGPCSGGPPG